MIFRKGQTMSHAKRQIGFTQKELEMTERLPHQSF